VLTPKQEMAGVEKILVDLAPTDHAIQAVTIDDGLGNISVTRLTEVQKNLELTDDRFTFTPPEGVELVPYSQ